MENLLKDIKDLKVLVMGDCMIDRYIWGKVDRISPEAPVPVLNWESNEDRLGGAANVALNAKQFDLEVAICGICGQDNNGDLLLDLAKEAGIQNDFIYRSEDRPTSVKTRVLSGQQHLLRVDRESTQALNDDELEDLQSCFDYALKHFRPDILILQDYNKGLLVPRLIEHVLQTTAAYDTFVAVDPKKHNFSLYKKVDLFKPNLKETIQALQYTPEIHQRGLDEAAKRLNSFLSAKNIMITLSEHGIYYTDNSGNSGIAPTQSRAIVDVCGAGDAVLTVAALALKVGYSLKETAKLSNIAGGQVCETVGVSTVDVDQLFRELNGKG
jgi:rfaE bifunctional protein kinase chain/domain